MKQQGHKVIGLDIIDRGYKGTQVIDFLTYEPDELNRFDVITNPPYKYATKFVKHALDISEDGVKVAMLLKVQFLESQERWRLFQKYMPVSIHPFIKRIDCSLNGDFENNKGGAIAYCWFVWIKGVRQDPVVQWVNTGDECKPV